MPVNIRSQLHLVRGSTAPQATLTRDSGNLIPAVHRHSNVVKAWPLPVLFLQIAETIPGRDALPTLLILNEHHELRILSVQGTREHIHPLHWTHGMGAGSTSHRPNCEGEGTMSLSHSGIRGAVFVLQETVHVHGSPYILLEYVHRRP